MVVANKSGLKFVSNESCLRWSPKKAKISEISPIQVIFFKKNLNVQQGCIEINLLNKL